jgi:two-component system alkaline phosphatase synthesis response regulator PhoP
VARYCDWEREPEVMGKTRPRKVRKTLRVDGHIVDLEKRTLKNGRGSHHLTHIECRLLCALMRREGQIVTRKTLMKEVWATDYLGDTRTLDVHICWLRQKLEEDPHRPVRIKTIRGVGYRFGTD